MVLTDEDIDRIRKNGVVGTHGNHIKGNAALLRYLSVGESCATIEDFSYHKSRMQTVRRTKKARSA